MQPGDIVAFQVHTGLALLSFLISAAGAYVALVASARIRTAGEAGRPHLGYVALAAIALGGIGIWSMHFVGMLAQRFPFALEYGGGLTLLSLLIALVGAGFALWYVGSAPFSPRRCVLAGTVAGLAVAGMHYLGVAAIRMPAYFEWRASGVVLSVAIAIVAAIAALWLAFNLVSERQRWLAAGVMAVAVSGMHYTGAAAGTAICTAAAAGSRGVVLADATLPYLVFGLSLAVLLLMRWQLHRTASDVQSRAARHVDALLHGAGDDVPPRAGA